MIDRSRGKILEFECGCRGADGIGSDSVRVTFEIWSSHKKESIDIMVGRAVQG